MTHLQASETAARFELIYEPAKHVRRCLECGTARQGHDIYCTACRTAINRRAWDNLRALR